jgi:hypothetical protein
VPGKAAPLAPAPPGSNPPDDDDDDDFIEDEVVAESGGEDDPEVDPMATEAPFCMKCGSHHETGEYNF